MRKLSLRYSALLCASAVILIFCGCAVGKPLAFDKETHLQQLRQKRPQGLGYSVAVAPVLVYRVPGAKSKKQWPLTVKATDLQKEITAAFKEIPVFTNVLQIPEAEITRHGFQMELADQSRVVTGLCQVFGQHGKIFGRQGRLVGSHAVRIRVVSRKQRRPCRSAGHCRTIGTGKQRPFAGQSVQVGGLYHGMIQDTQAVVPVLVGEDQENVHRVR